MLGVIMQKINRFELGMTLLLFSADSGSSEKMSTARSAAVERMRTLSFQAVRKVKQ